MNLSDIIAINICKQGSDNMRIAICDDEVSMVQILEEKIKKLRCKVKILDTLFYSCYSL